MHSSLIRELCNICIIRGENYAILVTISYAFTAYWNLGKFTFSDTGKKFQYEYIPNYERQENTKRRNWKESQSYIGSESCRLVLVVWNRLIMA